MIPKTYLLSIFVLLTLLFLVELSNDFQQRDLNKKIETIEKKINSLVFEPPLPIWEENP